VGTVTSWAWDFDNNGSTDSTAQNPLYTYNTPGTYTVTLTVTGPGGSDVKQSIDYIHASTSSLTADFSASATVTFTDQSVGTVTSWAWDFDNNGSTDSTAQNPLYTYNTPGTYTVTLTVTGPADSDVRQRTDYVDVSEVPPESEFDANPTSGTVPLSVQFIDLSIGPVTDWYWEFGDGQTSAAQNPVYEYQSGGDYTVTLTVSGPGGSDAKGKVDYIHVGELPPEPDFIGDPLSGDAPLTVQFTDLSTGVISDWYWDFGDGEISTEQSPFHTYQMAGAYTVELTVTGPGGSEFRGKTDYIQVNDEPPVSDFSASSTSGMRPLRVDFTDLSTGVITDYYWEFGDGDVSTEQNPTHDYHLPGDYTVTLTVSGPGGSDIRGKIDYIHVDEAPPVADFIASPIIVARGTNVQFTDLSIGTIADYYWEFGDGDTSTEQHPSHAYQFEGYYTVRLTVTAPAGLDVRERINYVYVSSGPVAEFVANPTSGTRPVTVQFTDLSMGSVTDYLWEFGDGQTSTEQNPFHQYQAEGDYTVRLTVSGPDGSHVRERVDHIHAGEETWWAKTYGSPSSFGNDRAQSVQPTADGGYIVAGWAAYSSDMWISKLNSDGTIRWQKAYDGTKGDYARSIQVTADGGCIVTGDTYSFGDGYHPDIWLLKIDSDGSRSWQRTYGDIGSQRAYAIQETADGGYIMAGESHPGNRYDFWVLKLNSNGTSVWQKTYSVGGGYDRAYAVQQTLDGGYVVCGESNFDFWILKLDSDGTVAWEKTYDEGGWNRARSIEQTADGGYIVAGEGDSSLWVLKLNADGTVAWQKTYGGGGYDAASSILQTPDGGYVMAGSTSSFGQGDYDVWILKLNADGTIDWEKTYGGSDDDEATQIRKSGDGYILAGYTESFGDGYNNYPDIWVLSLAPDGEIPQCSAMTTSNAIVTDTTVDPEDSNAFILETHLLPLITSIDPFDTLVETSTVCSAVPVSQADFVADVTSGFVPLFVQFTDQSTGTVTDWFWDFGDGETSTEQNPSHVYDEAGDYNVSLTIDGPDGVDIETKSHYIEVLHFADFSASPLTGMTPMTVFFVDESSGNLTAWFWDFGDGKTSTKRNPTHTYYDIGYYTVSLTVTGSNGQDTITRINYIYLTDYGAPVIEWLNPTSCEPKDRLRIRGYNFGDVQGESVVHIGRGTFDASSSRIKLWSNTRIVISVPNYKCVWFKGEPSRNRRVWVTVDSVDSNKRKLEVLKPAACP
jgi:uncharacterized delta-60 repeat protein